MILGYSEATYSKAEERIFFKLFFTTPSSPLKWEGKTILQSPKHERNLLNECDNLYVNKCWD